MNWPASNSILFCRYGREFLDSMEDCEIVSISGMTLNAVFFFARLSNHFSLLYGAVDKCFMYICGH